VLTIAKRFIAFGLPNMIQKQCYKIPLFGCHMQFLKTLTKTVAQAILIQKLKLKVAPALQIG
jgi:hypothetical protein